MVPAAQQEKLTQSEILRNEMDDHIQIIKKNEPNGESGQKEPLEQMRTQTNDNEIQTEGVFSEHNFYKDTNLFQYTNSN